VRRLGAIVIALTLGQTLALASGNRVMCRDGSWASASRNACRHRGGIASAGRRPPLARCRDGSIQHASSRTCRFNGGVAHWM
jgi:hypothetical protein